MNFSEECKIAAQSLNPDSEALARMKANVLKQIAAQENSAQSTENILSKPKNSLPMARRIAVFGGSAAACAVIALCAVKLAPVFNDSSKLTNFDAISSNESADIKKDNGTAGGEAFDRAENEELGNSADAYSADSLKSAEDGYVDEKSFEKDDNAERFSDEEAADDAVLEECEVDETEEYAETEDMTMEAFDGESFDSVDESEETEIIVTPNVGGKEALMFGEGYVSTVVNISEDRSTIWIYGDGDHSSKSRYMLVSAEALGADDLPSVVLLNETDGAQYLVKLEKGRPNCIYVYDSDGNFLGKYRKNA